MKSTNHLVCSIGLVISNSTKVHEQVHPVLSFCMNLVMATRAAMWWNSITTLSVQYTKHHNRSKAKQPHDHTIRMYCPDVSSSKIKHARFILLRARTNGLIHFLQEININAELRLIRSFSTKKDLIRRVQTQVCGSHRSTYPKIVVSRWRFVVFASS